MDVISGYRHIRLLDQNNQPLIPASLFVKVSYKDVGDFWSPEERSNEDNDESENEGNNSADNGIEANT